MRKRRAWFLPLLCVLALLLPGCAAAQAQPVNPSDGRLRIVTTLFPQYDFARVLTGGQAEVTLLLPPGLDSHSFEPSPADMSRISSADLFVYTGEGMEPWAQSLLDSLPEDGPRVVDLSAGIDALVEAQPDKFPFEPGHEEHTGHTHPGDLPDPHIWTSPVLAKEMVQTLADALCAQTPDQRDFYQENLQAYLAELDQLDAELRAIVQQAPQAEMVFGSSFPFYYFTQEYGLAHAAAFDSCAGDNEPSVRVMAELIDRLRAQEHPAIFYDSQSSRRVTDALARETGAVAIPFYACHNLTREQLEAGEGYLSMMRQNAENMRKGLGI